MSNSLSYWEKEYISKNVDIVVIGAGIVGLSSAYFLKQKFPKKKIVVLERAYPGMGASTKNAGFACFGSPTELMADLDSMSEHEAVKLLRMRWDGLNTLKSLVPVKLMKFSDSGSVELFQKDEDTTVDLIISELDNLNTLVQEATGQDDCFSVESNKDFPSLHSACFLNKYEGQLNPMLMMAELNKLVRAADVPIIYGANVESLDMDSKKIHLDSEITIQSSQIILCANGFSKKFLRSEFDDLKAVRNQVLISEEIQDLPFCGTFHMNKGYLYFRTYGTRILIGGGRDLDFEGETTSDFGAHPEIIDYLKAFSSEHLLPNREIQWDHQWSGILGVGTSKMPILKEVKPGIYAAVRLGGMGVAIGCGLGRSVAEML